MYVGCKTLFLVGTSQLYPDFDEDVSEVGPLVGYACYGFSEGCKMPVKLLYRTRGLPVTPGTILAVTGSLAFEYPNIVLGSTAIHHATALDVRQLDFRFVPRVHIDGNITAIVRAERDGDMTALTFDCVVHGPVDTTVRCRFKHRDSDLPIIRKMHKVSLVGAVSGHADHLITVKVFSFGCILYPGHIGRRDVLYYPEGAQARRFTVVGVYLPLNEGASPTTLDGATQETGGRTTDTDVSNDATPNPPEAYDPVPSDPEPFLSPHDNMLSPAPGSTCDPSLLRPPLSSFPFDPSAPGAAQKYLSSAHNHDPQFLSASSALEAVDPSFLYSTPCLALQSPGTDATIEAPPTGTQTADDSLGDDAAAYGLYAGPEDLPLTPGPVPIRAEATATGSTAVITTSQEIPFDYYESFAEDLLPGDAFDMNARLNVPEYYETAVYMD